MLLREFSLREGLGQDLLELWYEHGKDLVKVVDGQSFLEEVQQRVVRMSGWVEMFCLLPFQVGYFLEVRLEDSKISLLPRPLHGTDASTVAFCSCSSRSGGTFW